MSRQCNRLSWRHRREMEITFAFIKQVRKRSDFGRPSISRKRTQTKTHGVWKHVIEHSVHFNSPLAMSMLKMQFNSRIEQAIINTCDGWWRNVKWILMLLHVYKIYDGRFRFPRSIFSSCGRAYTRLLSCLDISQQLMSTLSPLW